MAGENTGFFQLFTNQTTNGSSNPIQFNFPQGRATIKAWGTWNGAVVVVETSTSPKAGTPVWIRVGDFAGNPVQFTGDVQRTLEDLMLGENLRVTVSNITGVTNLNATIEIIGK